MKKTYRRVNLFILLNYNIVDVTRYKACFGHNSGLSFILSQICVCDSNGSFASRSSFNVRCHVVTQHNTVVEVIFFHLS